MKENADFALLLDEYARLKTKHEQLQNERKWLLSQVKSKHDALSKAQKALQRLQTERAQERYKARRAQERQNKQPKKKPAIGDWAYWILYIISICFIPIFWFASVMVAIRNAQWDLNAGALFTIILIILPLSVFLTLLHERKRQEEREERQRLQRLYEQQAAAPAEQVGEAEEPAKKQRGKTPRRITEKSRAPITRKLSEEELEPIAHAL